MKKKLVAFLISTVFSSALWADWKMVGNADYNWGPFQIYTLSLYSETGHYQENQRPLMLSFNFDKPVEGKSFAISLIKEINALKIEGDTDNWLAELQKIFPDFSPNDVLSYIALPNKGYFILNDTVLDKEFSDAFNRAFITSALSPKGSYSKILPQLVGKEKSTHSKEEPLLNTPDVEKIDEDELKPQLPPQFEFQQQTQEDS
ncbi:hypothetical protein L5B97_00660 [Avibacterium sp. 20-15]|uniref:hypothetical protein n=1 Tax=unclassified Avibacterium TaxID=2685287 RepID=UPI002026A7F4|nr:MULTISPECIES: hypothetical protein [unclassified Avibacterium]MCW9732012.1 hypothetical protein [Avibacterium sp. 20-15]URL04194.1 hypothetical protein L4F93_11740 [Avibacterium sp. 20-132]